MLERRKEKNKASGGVSGAPKQRLVIVDDAPPAEAKSGGCC